MRVTLAIPVALLLAISIGSALWIFRRPTSIASRPIRPRLDTPSPSATWPWPGVQKSQPHRGVTRWFLPKTGDGTSLELFEFDFATNPKLRFELYDQDEDDENPGDNLADYYDRGVGQIARHLNERGPGKVVAAWNGPFFAYDFQPGTGPHGKARHVGPVILRGNLKYNVGNPRWTVGVKQTGQVPQFRVRHQPDKRTAAQEFTFGAAGAQCLILDGKSLRLQPYPREGDPPLPQPVPSTPEEAGHIPLVDHMRTSRTSMACSQDSRKLYLLIVNEPDNELESKLAVKRDQINAGGWLVADLQRFWKAFGAWTAVNIDGGAVTQMTFLREDGKYELLPPRLVSPNQRLLFGPDFQGAPQGGTLMTFYIREAP